MKREVPEKFNGQESAASQRVNELEVKVNFLERPRRKKQSCSTSKRTAVTLHMAALALLKAMRALGGCQCIKPVAGAQHRWDKNDLPWPLRKKIKSFFRELLECLDTKFGWSNEHIKL